MILNFINHLHVKTRDVIYIVLNVYVVVDHLKLTLAMLVYQCVVEQWLMNIGTGWVSGLHVLIKDSKPLTKYAGRLIRCLQPQSSISQFKQLECWGIDSQWF